MLDLELWDKINASRDKSSDINTEEFNLFNKLNIKLKALKGDDFTIISSWIGNGIDYNITTSATGLPERVGLLFFCLDKKCNVQCQEITFDINDGKGCDERHFIISINISHPNIVSRS